LAWQAVPEDFTDRPDLLPFLGSSPWIQAGDPEIVRRAHEIAGEEPSILGRAERILRWVHAWITPVPTITIPSSRQVLETRRGDCNEYTALFTALARAAGVPTRMQAGVVYRQGRFFYHAWPEIFAGSWIAIDPTFAQVPADATHIPLVEGDVDAQIGLVQQLGKINLIILETE